MQKENKKKYNIEYRKKHKVQFNVDLNKEEMKSLNEALKISKTRKVDFLRKAIKKECRNNNILYFDRVTNCDWCGKKDYVSITHYGTTNYNRLICRNCANDIIQHQMNIYGSEPSWYRPNDEE